MLSSQWSITKIFEQKIVLQIEFHFLALNNMFLKDRNSQIIKKKVEERNGTIRIVNSQKESF